MQNFILQLKSAVIVLSVGQIQVRVTVVVYIQAILPLPFPFLFSFILEPDLQDLTTQFNYFFQNKRIKLKKYLRDLIFL
jgi:hypothetical protein